MRRAGIRFRPQSSSGPNRASCLASRARTASVRSALTKVAAFQVATSPRNSPAAMWIVSPLCEAVAAARTVAYCLPGPTVRMRPVAAGQVKEAPAGGGAAGGGGAGAGDGGDDGGPAAAGGAALSDPPPHAESVNAKKSALAPDLESCRECFKPIPPSLGAADAQHTTRGAPYSAVKNPFILSTKLFERGECFSPPSLSDVSSSRSNFFCLSVNRTGVSTTIWQ